MFSFHKPKIFRSVNGCCICKAKSSSSRFTDSKRYEPLFEKCFGLDEERSGEICNACVLLVKRYMKLPAGSSRHWNHVVDARSGPGIKSIVRAKKQVKSKPEDENQGCDTPDKIKRKHVYQKRNKRAPLADKIVRNRNPSIDISPFLDMTVWRRQKVCCGTIFCAPNGEIAIDMRYLTPCTSCGRTISAPIAAAAEDILMDDLDSEEAETETEATKFSEEDSNLDADDEGFFDRPAVSPESGSCTPPPLMIAT